jgi:hypothetical protein
VQLTTGKKDASGPLVKLDNDINILPANPFCKSAQDEFRLNQFLMLLKQSQWLVEDNMSRPKDCNWSTGIAAQEVSNNQYDHSFTHSL